MHKVNVVFSAVVVALMLGGCAADAGSSASGTGAAEADIVSSGRFTGTQFPMGAFEKARTGSDLTAFRISVSAVPQLALSSFVRNQHTGSLGFQKAWKLTWNDAPVYALDGFDSSGTVEAVRVVTEAGEIVGVNNINSGQHFGG